MHTIDLFSGCGGMSLGFTNAGFEILASYEIWDSAIECFRANFKHPVIKMDLSDVDNAVEDIKKYNPDMIIGGPPCQDFSDAGKRVESDRATLTVCFAKIVCSVKPNYFVMENVARSMKSDAYAVSRKLFKDSGYGLTEIVLNASLCGVPQKRKRFICIGSMGDSDGFAEEIIHRNLSDKPLTVREYLGDDLDMEYYYRHPRNYSRRGIFSVDEPAPTIRGVNRPIPKNYVIHKGDAISDLDEVDSLTMDQRALIQTFPKDFNWIGPRTSCEQMIGNAVPVKLAEFIANVVKEYSTSIRS